MQIEPDDPRRRRSGTDVSSIGRQRQRQVPLGATPFAVSFGMVAGRFGVVWTITAR